MRAAALLCWLALVQMGAAGAAPLPGLEATAPGAAGALPPGVSETDRVAIRGVIGRQLEAFRADDAAGAYAAAAPNIKRLFPEAEGFMAMVRRAYPPVYRPRSAEFSELALRDGELVQEVELVGPDGTPKLAVYTMERGADGQWRIAGCVLIPSARMSV